MDPETRGINTMRERSLHAALKAWYAKPGDRLEVRVGGYVIDLVRDNVLIEFQTRNFAALKTKLTRLLDEYQVHLVYPVPQRRWIVKLDSPEGQELSRRRSPLQGNVIHLFNEMVYLPHLVSHKHFSLEVLLIHDEEIRCDDGQGSWRRKGWSIIDRRLLEVTGGAEFSNLDDYRALLPPDLPAMVTTADVAERLRIRRTLARKMVYCLRAMGILEQTGKQGNAFVYRQTS